MLASNSSEDSNASFALRLPFLGLKKRNLHLDGNYCSKKWFIEASKVALHKALREKNDIQSACESVREQLLDGNDN